MKTEMNEILEVLKSKFYILLHLIMYIDVIKADTYSLQRFVKSVSSHSEKAFTHSGSMGREVAVLMS